MTTRTETRPPRWDMTPFFPSLDSPEFADEFEGTRRAIAELRGFFDDEGVGRTEVAAVDDAHIARFERIIERTSEVRDRLRTVNAFVYAFLTTDSRNELAQARHSELQALQVEATKLSTRFRAWLGSLDVEALIGRSAVAKDHAFAVRKAHMEARHQMSPAEEDLAASLAPSAQTAWGRLHGNVTSRMSVTVELPDDPETMPMSAVRGLAHNADARVREAAYRAELAAWESVEVPCAAALNAIKGWQHTLNERRGWADSIEPALFENNVDRATLEAMQQACIDSFPDFRRYLRAKAKLLGRSALPWWDLFAPVGAPESATWDYARGVDFIVHHFRGYSDALGDLAERSFREDWIDAEPRADKRDGGYCMGVRDDVSRIFVNFTDSFGSVSTLAHELGHAYHNTRLAPRTPLQRQTPMALAETASIFCQTITNDAMLAEAPAASKLAILEEDLQHTCQIVVDIHSRFVFEKAVFEGRAKRELSAHELCEAMFDAQRQTYGDGLDGEALHPYMWAVKPHYYSSNYYNWPYTFGLLFGLGLYARYREDPGGFRGGYDDLLSSTGMADAATLTARFGADVRTQEFWRSSLDQIRERVVEFESLVG